MLENKEIPCSAKTWHHMADWYYQPQKQLLKNHIGRNGHI